MEVTMDITSFDFTKYLSRQITTSLSKKYGFDFEEAINYLSINSERQPEQKKEIGQNSKNKNSIPLPFCNTINKNCCYGVKLNYGLYTQCTNSQTVYNSKFPLCLTCARQADKNSNDQPNYGFITNRLELGEEFRDPKGKAPVNYANIMDKFNITREQAQEEAKKLGLTIPEEQFVYKKAVRGRPKKDTTAYDTESDTSSVSSKTEKRRGRPKKVKDVISNDISSDILKTLVEETDKTNPLEDKCVEVDEEENVDDSEEDGCTAIAIKLNKSSKLGYDEVDEDEADYLLTGTNNIHKPFTHEHIGFWNLEKKKVEIMADSESE